MSFKSISKFLGNYPLHGFKNLLFLSLANLPMPEHTFRPILVRWGGGKKRLRFKYIVSKTPPVSWYLAITKHFNDKKLLKLRESYIPKISEIVTPDTSIISSNCFAGRIM